MKSEVIIGLLIGYVLWRWFSGQSILPSLRDEAEFDSTEFDSDDMEAINSLS